MTTTFQEKKKTKLLLVDDDPSMVRHLGKNRRPLLRRRHRNAILDRPDQGEGMPSRGTSSTSS